MKGMSWISLSPYLRGLEIRSNTIATDLIAKDHTTRLVSVAPLEYSLRIFLSSEYAYKYVALIKVGNVFIFTSFCYTEAKL